MGSQQGLRFWTKERVKLLAQLWPTKLSAEEIAKRIGNTPLACQKKASNLGYRKRKSKKVARDRQGQPVFGVRTKPESAAQSAIWAGVQFTDHPAAARPEGKLRGLPEDSSARSMVGCAAALAASN